MSDLENNVRFGKYTIIPNVISYISKDLHQVFYERELKTCAKWAQIYNSYRESENQNLSSNRYSKRFAHRPACLSTFIKVLSQVNREKDIHYHSPNGFACIFSMPGCMIQKHHVDYPGLINRARATWSNNLPLVGIVALEDQVSLLVEDKQVHIPKYHALLMRADVVHQGNNYRNCSGMRLHFYVDYANMRASDGEFNGFIDTKIWRSKNNQKNLVHPKFIY